MEFGKDSSKIRLKIIPKFFLAVMVVILAIGLVFHSQIIRLYKLNYLFDSSTIVRNFRNMGALYDSRIIQKGETIHRFERREADLPEKFICNDKEYDLKKFLDDTWTTGMVVVKDNTILFEKYYLGNTEKSKSIAWSTTKSVVSAMIGCAVEEGVIRNIHQPVTEYVSLLKKSGYNGVTIKNALQMSSGIKYSEKYTDFNSDSGRMGRAVAFGKPLDDFVASLVSKREQGIFNQYSSMDTQVLGMVLREASGMTMSAFLEEYIWKKVGMESDAYWIMDDHGMEQAYGGINAVLRDYARFGQLYLNNGKMNGEQIIPAEWIKASITPDAPYLLPGKNPSSDHELGYGYQWWLPQNPEGDYLAIGIYDQFIYVHPTHKMVIVKSSADPDYHKYVEETVPASIAMFRKIAKTKY